MFNNKLTIYASRSTLFSMCVAGLVMTWSGVTDGPGEILHKALEKIYTDSRKDVVNLASIAVPPWSALSRDTQEKLKTQVLLGYSSIIFSSSSNATLGNKVNFYGSSVHRITLSM